MLGKIHCQGCKDFLKPSKPYHDSVHKIGLIEYSLHDEYQYVRVSVIFSVFASFCIGRISHQQHKG